MQLHGVQHRAVAGELVVLVEDVQAEAAVVGPVVHRLPGDQRQAAVDGQLGDRRSCTQCGQPQRTWPSRSSRGPRPAAWAAGRRRTPRAAARAGAGRRPAAQLARRRRRSARRSRPRGRSARAGRARGARGGRGGSPAACSSRLREVATTPRLSAAHAASLRPGPPAGMSLPEAATGRPARGRRCRPGRDAGGTGRDGR